MATNSSIKVVKSFTYRGETREFANRYYLDTHLATEGHFDTFADNVVDLEKVIYDPDVTIVRVDYTPEDSTLTLYSKTYDTPGTTTTFDGTTAPGDCAALVRYTTDQRSSRNHAVYLFNYYHSPKIMLAPDQDTLSEDYFIALQTYAQAWLDGISSGTINHSRVGPHGAIAQTQEVQAAVTHRDLPRRS